MWGQVERCAREDSKETGGSLPAQQLEFNLYLRSSSSQVSVHISSNLSMLVVTHEYALCSIKADPPLFIGKRVTEKWRYCELNSGLCNLCCFPAKIAIDSSYPRLIRLLIFNRTLVAHLSYTETFFCLQEFRVLTRRCWCRWSCQDFLTWRIFKFK